jgi:hypothetical protein
MENVHPIEKACKVSLEVPSRNIEAVLWYRVNMVTRSRLLELLLVIR